MVSRVDTRRQSSRRYRAPIEPYSVDIPEAVLADLRDRLRATRWPDASPGEPWSQGTDLAYLGDLVAYWADGFDWRAQERELNRFEHFRTELDGVLVHFVHARGTCGSRVPLILTHGWPSSFAEYLPLVPLLTDPAAHGIDGPAFDLVIPSLPGYAFSERPARPLTTRDTARLWHRLMRELGYERYGAGGGDFGAGVATYMALDDPAPVLGLHLTTIEVWPYRGPCSRPPTDAEQAFLDASAHWAATERGYSSIQSTKPQTVGYALHDSPAGLAGWIVEKWRSWTDSGGDLDRRFTREFLLTLITLYWATGSITTTLRDYYDNRWAGTPIGPEDFVDVPTAFGGFFNHFVPEGDPPREFLERLYRVTRWTPMPAGGHFAPAEEPERLARDIAAFFGSLT
jgi:pimeloyl-ACP methyl ester carboxylesterase